MDLRRRFARGTLGEVFGVFGETVFAIDREARVFIATRDGGRLEERLWQNANAETQAAIRSYTRGVNAWIADLRARKNGARSTENRLTAIVGNELTRPPASPSVFHEPNSHFDDRAVILYEKGVEHVHSRARQDRLPRKVSSRSNP